MKKTIIIILLWFPASIFAQNQQSLAFDSKGTIFEITPELRGEFGLFPNIMGFQSAKLFKGSNDNFELIFETQNGELFRRLKPADLQEMRNKVDQGLDDRIPLMAKDTLPTKPGGLQATYLDQSGKADFLAGTITAGIILVAPAILNNLGDISTKEFIGAAFLTAGVGFLLPRILLKDKPISEAQGYANKRIPLIALGQGIGIGLMVNNGKLTDEFIYGSVLAGAGMYFGYKYVEKQQLTLGPITLTYNLAGIYGPLVGVIAPTLSGARNTFPYGAGIVLGGIGGFFGAKFLYERSNYTQGDAELMTIVTPLTIITTIGAVVVNPNYDVLENQLAIKLGVASTLVGVLISDKLIQKHDLDMRDIKFISLGTLAGGLTGLGVSFLADFGNSTVLVSSLSACLGFGLTYYSSINDKTPSIGFVQKINISPKALLTEENKIVPGMGLSIRLN